MLHIRGFDEDYLYAGWEDEDIAQRFVASGIQFIFSPDAIVHHQYHPSAAGNDLACRQAEINAQLFIDKQQQRARRDIGDVRNIGREWGVDRCPI
jgi:GT2 family glycosyltransferase